MEFDSTWLGIGTAALLLLFAFMGYRRGFVKEVVSTFLVILTLVVVWGINPYVKIALENTPVYSRVEKECETFIQDKMEEEAQEKEDSLIESLPLPQSMKSEIAQNNTGEVYQYLQVNTFAEYIARYLASVLLNGISFILSFILASILIGLAVHALDLITKLPILHGINKVAGIAVGGMKGILFVWILLLILTIFCKTPVGKVCMEMVSQDPFLSFLYEKNILVDIFLSIFY